MSIEEQKRLSQANMLELLKRDIQLNDMITVYFSEINDKHNYGFYCALIPADQIEQALSNPSWDFLHGDGMPGAIEYYKEGETNVQYLRYGDDDGIEPLILDREFYGIRDNYKEIAEEFRLFHRLYHDKKDDKYIKIDDDGNEHTVAIIEPNRIQIRLKEIRQFLAIKDMHLSIQFDCRENSIKSLKELGLKEGGGDQRDGLICWGHHYGELSGISGYRAFSRLLGKRLFAPLPKSKSGFWGFAEEPKKKDVEFIIGVDEDGEEVTYTSEPDALANYFGANPDAPHYLTPVHFRKQVLDKYYQQPSKYSVEDSILRCGYLWSMQLDNHHAEKVCAWLGDLGRDLPYEDQLHWRSYNIPPEGGVSETYFRRQILAQFTDSDRPEHLFKQSYFELRKICEEQLGWQLLLPLSDGDEHYFKSIRIPATDEQKDFDELILGLSKTLIDSLNEKYLNKLIPNERKTDIKGSIALLEVALSSCGVEDAEMQTSFLRKLQNLRSSSSAHRKGSNYEKIAQDLGIDSQNLRTVFTGILEKAIAVIEFYINVIRSGKLIIN